MCFFSDIQIGFAQSQYSFREPENETEFEIVLVRQGGRLSEQTFQVSISVGGSIDVPQATLGEDYRLTQSATRANFIVLNFPPDRQNITLTVNLLFDSLPEGTEGFRVTSTPSPRFPNFQPGDFAVTDVRIIDDDCKLACNA